MRIVVIPIFFFVFVKVVCETDTSKTVKVSMPISQIGYS
jgi:hypothetical protein